MSEILHILHVDDNPFDRQLVLDALEEANGQFLVTPATSRQDFESQLTGGTYDLVLSDFNILGFEGFQVIDAVHKNDPMTPVIVVTGTGSEEIAVTAMKCGAADYVIKSPKHIRRLPLIIQTAMEKKHLQKEHLESQEALRVSEERLRAFANALPDMAFIMDEQGNYLQFLNPSEHPLYQQGIERLGKNVQDVLPQLAAAQVKEAIRRTISSKQTQSIEYQRETPHGWAWFEGRFSLMENVSDEKILLVYIVRDITDRKLAEEKLLRERNLLRTLIDNIPDYIFAKNRDGHFIASNLAHAAAAQMTPPDIIGKTSAEIFQPEIAQMFHNDDEKVMTTGQALINEERPMFDIGGHRQWVLTTKVPLYNEDKKVIGLVGISRDISQRKAIEEALRASEAHLRTVVSGTPVILFALDLEARVTLLQGQGLAVFGLEPDAYLGTSVNDLKIPSIYRFRAKLLTALAGNEINSVETIAGRTFDIRVSPMRDDAGKMNGVIGVATDITERLAVERMKLELEKEQEIIALKERFIATASHDFRSPLSVIKMSATMLESQFDKLSPERRIAKLRGMSTQIDRMVQLLDEVLIISQANAGKLDFNPEPVVLETFCEQIWESFQMIAENTHKIDFIYHSDYETVLIDPNLVHYILNNLLSNAIKYSPNNKYVRFEVQASADTLIFQIEDKGIGIPTDEQNKLFQPFYRAVNSQGIAGTGLGLSIVKSYVDCHQGQISFESEEGKGTCFTVKIPIL